MLSAHRRALEHFGVVFGPLLRSGEHQVELPFGWQFRSCGVEKVSALVDEQGCIRALVSRHEAHKFCLVQPLLSVIPDPHNSADCVRYLVMMGGELRYTTQNYATFDAGAGLGVGADSLARQDAEHYVDRFSSGPWKYPGANADDEALFAWLTYGWDS